MTITITLANLNPAGAGGMIGRWNCLALPSSSSSSLRQVVSMLNINSSSNYNKYYNNNIIKYIYPRSRPVTIVDSSKQISSTCSEENNYNNNLRVMMIKNKANATSNSPVRGRNKFVDALSRILASLLSYGLVFTFTITLHTLYATNSALALSYDRMGGSSSSLLSLSSSSLSSTSHSSSSNCQNTSPSVHINIVFPYPFQSCASLAVMILAGLYSKLIHLLLELLIMSEQDGSLFSFQIAVSDKERALRRKLKKIAENADTSTLNGLNYVLKEVVKALLQYNDSSIHFTNLQKRWGIMKILSKRFEEFLDNELRRHRHGGDENTMVNADKNVEYKNKTNMVKAYSSTENEYTLVTVLVLATGKHSMPYFNKEGRSYHDSFEVFQTLQRIPENEIRSKYCGRHEKKMRFCWRISY